MSEKLYKCDYPGCNVTRTKAQGGKIFTVCDKHWDYFSNSPKKERNDSAEFYVAMLQAIISRPHVVEFLKKEVGESLLYRENNNCGFQLLYEKLRDIKSIVNCDSFNLSYINSELDESMEIIAQLKNLH